MSATEVARPMGGESSASGHPDVRLLVKLDQAGRIVYDVVDSGSSESFMLPIRASLRDYLKPLYAEIEGLSQDTPEERLIAERRLAGFGERLCQRLFPRELQLKLYELAAGRRLLGQAAPTLHLISDECSVPWELLRLPEPAGAAGGLGGLFLAEAFALSRWFGRYQPSLELPLGHVALVISKEGGLRSTKAERTQLQDLLQRQGRYVEMVPPTYLDVTARLASGEPDGWHFSGHGSSSEQNPDLQSLQLTVPQVLNPTDLEGKPRFGEKRPLVFLNACKSGQGGFALTGIGGWAEAFLGAGAGAFIGAHWSVSDAEASVFAVAFYERFVSGMPVAEAARHARLALRKQFPGNPTWLAYTVFAHPLAGCKDRPTAELDHAEARPPILENPGVQISGSNQTKHQNWPWIGLGLLFVLLIIALGVNSLYGPQSSTPPVSSPRESEKPMELGSEDEKPASPPPPVETPPPKLPSESKASEPTISSKSYRVQLVLPIPLEQPSILVDGKEALIVESTPTIITVQVPPSDANQKFEVISQKLACQASRFISEDTRIPLVDCR